MRAELNFVGNYAKINFESELKDFNRFLHAVISLGPIYG